MGIVTNVLFTSLPTVVCYSVIIGLKRRNYSEAAQSALISVLLATRVVVPCITGGVACGKTQVSNKLSEMGYKIIDMDIISREIVSVGKPAYKEIVKSFGRDILDNNLEINRTKLKTIIFNDPNKRRKLNRITHYHIIIQTILMVIYYRIYLLVFKLQNVKIVIVSPLLFENGALTKATSPIYVVATTRQQQIKNLMARDNCTRDLASKMINSQISLEVKCRLADKVIWNTGTLEELYASIRNSF